MLWLFGCYDYSEVDSTYLMFLLLTYELNCFLGFSLYKVLNKVLYIRDPSGSNIQDVELKKFYSKNLKTIKSETFESAFQFDDPKKS